MSGYARLMALRAEGQAAIAGCQAFIAGVEAMLVETEAELKRREAERHSARPTLPETCPKCHVDSSALIALEGAPGKNWICRACNAQF